MEKYNFVKSRDAWITVFFFDVFAIPMARISHRYFKFLTPDHFTFLSLYSFVLAIVALFSQYPLLAVILMFTSTILDCVDGKLARLTKTNTVHGKYLDALCDFLSHSFGFLAIAYWFYINSNFFAAVVVVFWSVYLGMMHINSVLKPRNEQSVISDGINEKWDKWCDNKRLIRLPLSDVEIAFFIIPTSILLGSSAGLFLTFFSILVFFSKKVIK